MTVAGADLLDFDFFLLLLSAWRTRFVVLSFELASGLVFLSILFLFLSFSEVVVSSSVFGITTCISVRLGLLPVASCKALNVSLSFLFAVIDLSVVLVLSSLVIVVVVVWAMEVLSC